MSGWSVRPRENGVALVVDVRDAERWTNCRLVRIRRGTCEIVPSKPRKEPILRRKLVIETDGKLISVRNHLRGSGEGARAERPARIVWNRVTVQKAADRRINGYEKRI